MRSRKSSSHHIPNYYHRIWRSKAFVVVLCFMVVMILISISKEVIRRVETRYEIQQLEGKVAQLQERNAQMQQVIMLLNTSTVQERESRIKLGMQAPGEHLVIVPNRGPQEPAVLSDADSIQYTTATDTRSNPEKWLYYFREKFYTTH